MLNPVVVVVAMGFLLAPGIKVAQAPAGACHSSGHREHRKATADEGRGARYQGPGNLDHDDCGDAPKEDTHIRDI